MSTNLEARHRSSEAEGACAESPRLDRRSGEQSIIPFSVTNKNSVAINAISLANILL